MFRRFPSAFSRVFLICSVMTVANASTGPAAGGDPLSHLNPAAPAPAVIVAARRAKIALNRFDEPVAESNGRRLLPGDGAVALITFFENGRPETQWLVRFEVPAVPLETKSGAGKAAPLPLIMYSGMGSELHFVSEPAQMNVRVFGPFPVETARVSAPAVVAEKNSRFTVDRMHLALGLDRAAALVVRVRATGEKGNFDFGNKPFPEVEVAAGRAFAMKAHITREDERAFAGTMPVLFEFFRIAQRTPGLRDLLWRTLDLPSGISMLRNLGVGDVKFALRGSEVTRLDSSAWHLAPGQPAWLLPFDLMLNDHPSLVCRLVVTEPRPPRLVSGGIVAIVAESPSKSGKFVAFHLLSATRGAVNPPTSAAQ